MDRVVLDTLTNIVKWVERKTLGIRERGLVRGHLEPRRLGLSGFACGLGRGSADQRRLPPRREN